MLYRRPRPANRPLLAAALVAVVLVILVYMRFSNGAQVESLATPADPSAVLYRTPGGRCRLRRTIHCHGYIGTGNPGFCYVHGHRRSHHDSHAYVHGHRRSHHDSHAYVHGHQCSHHDSHAHTDGHQYSHHHTHAYTHAYTHGHPDPLSNHRTRRHLAPGAQHALAVAHRPRT
jgi:hypothetical protein